MKSNPEFKKVALLAVKKAGKILEENFQKKISVRYKKDLTPLTNIDLIANETIVGFLKKNFPSHNIFSEESGGVLGREFTWIIDPLDGTRNYVSGIPCFAVSLSLLRKREPVLGVIFNPINRSIIFCRKRKRRLFKRPKNQG